jgi:hypothetical protein
MRYYQEFSFFASGASFGLSEKYRDMHELRTACV